MVAMKLACIFGAVGARSAPVFLSGADTSCIANSEEAASLVLMSEKAKQLGVDCENMCKETGAYPNCACPGFEGQPASSDDTRACIDKYCQDPSAPCPNDAFVGCVKENTKVSALQQSALVSHISLGLDALSQTLKLAMAKGKTDSESSACAAQTFGFRALLQAKAQQMGVDCENMCKETGAYPNCQCPGFEGQPASADDTRACIDKYCQDPSAPCPNDAFVGCVKENTRVSALQFNALMKSVDSGLASLKQTMRLAKNATRPMIA